MKKTLSAILLLFTVCYGHSQTKVFREVGEDISSEVKTIRQDNNLVGYLVFTQLEKASADSFNYRISIMDENLNDIGTINFRDIKLSLQAVSFEQDVLCLAYLKSNFFNRSFKNRKAYSEALKDEKSAVFLQFLGLDGKIIKSNSYDIQITPQTTNSWYEGYTGKGYLKHSLQLSNIPLKGFACFYGDDRKSNLFIFNPAGEIIWQKNTTEQAQAFGLLASKQGIYLMVKKKDHMAEGGFELLGYDINDGSVYPKYTLKDKQGHALKVITFDNDPVSGKPYITGYIIDDRKGNFYYSAKQLARGPYAGVYTININGTKKSEIQEVFSYWGDGSQSFITRKGHFVDNNTYPRFVRSFKDFQGNTYFAGSTVIRKARWGSMFFTIVTIPLVVPPLIIASTGYSKGMVKEAVLMKQTEKGAISVDNFIEANNTGDYPGVMPISMYDKRSFYFVTNPDTKSNYIIIDDFRDIFVYNVNQRKVVRTVPHREGNIRTNVFPAKEGHVMVATYNKKEKVTQVSIEAL
jgi:hypothetical protein